ncbi:MAG: c-type cytochrome [Flavobacteriia bacterium]|nr:c-type cytochrome [Flavobacteriia bacterium]
MHPRVLHISLFTVLIGFVFMACISGKGKTSVDVPPHFPAMTYPENNRLTQDRIDLGRKLFYDPILSRNNEISCASCHKQSLAFADSAAISPGIEGRLGNRNAPTLGNVGYNPTVLFDCFLETLEKQVLVPIQEHAEMDFNIVDVSKRMKADPKYVEMCKKAYDREPDAFVITRAISAFERTLISSNSKYDAFLQGKKRLNAAEVRGKNLFFDRLYCSQCHGGFNFTDFSVRNNGLFPIYADSGRMRVTNLEVDRDVVKVPTLRNSALTAPYMHDGRFKTLRDVLHHYESGGENHPNKSAIIQPFTLTPAEENDLIAFLKTLTDKQFLTDKRFSKPK